MKYTFDPRFVEIEYELMTLGRYIDLIDANLSSIVEAERARIWEELDRRDEAERNTGWDLERHLNDGVTTRLLTAGVVLATWAQYESAVTKLAAHARSKRKISLKMSQVRGGLLERARTFFEDVLQFSLHPPGTDWDHLSKLYELRNLLAHANGRLWDVPSDMLGKAKSWIVATDGLNIVDDEYLVVSLPFAKSSYQWMDALLRDLTQRVRDEF